MNPREAVRKSALFSQLSEAELDKVASLLIERRVAAGETLIREGDEGYSLFILEEGHVQVLRNGDEGQPARISELGEGAMFGEMSFVENAPIHSLTQHPPRSAGVVAQGEARVLELRYDRLERLAESDPELGVKLYRALAVSLNEKLKTTTDHLLPLIASARLAALGQMTANIAHELNNPLAVLRSLSESLAERVRAKEHGAEAAEWALRIGATAARVGGVIAGLRSVSRDGSADPLVPADPERLLREALQVCEQRLRFFAIETRIEAPPQPLRALCRPVQVSQAVLNLLNNSVDAAAAAPAGAARWIRLGVRESEGKALITVQDSGPGVPPAIARRIFRPFFTTKGPGGGMGLGLSISRQLIESNGGRLELDPGGGGGASFSLWLPLCKDAAPSGPR